MAREVGCQAKIFRGAADSFVWLTTHTSTAIINWLQKLKKLGYEQGIPKTEAGMSMERWLSDLLAMLKWFLLDDWFSSLWTLQEAFLSLKAIFMFKDGLTPEILKLSVNEKGDIDLYRPGTCISTWQWFKRQSLFASLSSLFLTAYASITETIDITAHPLRVLLESSSVPDEN
ncbi:hypothetical protein F4860DRAFT_524993 [Xylaria cubensis]|nr:hypothetical protein F4860DRAFT_524993 [Xylaria cubensis]